MQTVTSSSTKVIDELEKKLEGALKDLRELKRREGEIPNARTRRLLKKAEDNWKKGRHSPVFENAEDAIAFLEKQGI